MKTIHLLGNIGTKFGTTWRGDCVTITDAFRLIECQTKGFREYLVNTTSNFGIRAGKDLIEHEAELLLNINQEDIYITEVPAGADSGWGKVFAAAAIIAVMYFTGGLAAPTGGGAGGVWFAGSTASNIVLAVAVNLAIAGVNEVLMPRPDKGKPGGAFFNGPINTIKQGQPVPVLYGELIIGGVPISINYTKRKINASGFVYNSATTVYGDFDAISDQNPEDMGVS